MIDLPWNAAVPEDTAEFREGIASLFGRHLYLQYQHNWYLLTDTEVLDALIYFRETDAISNSPAGTTVASAVLRSAVETNDLVVGVVERAAFPAGTSGNPASGILVPYHELAVIGPDNVSQRYDLRDAFGDLMSSVIALAHGGSEVGRYCVYVHRSTEVSPRDPGTMKEIHKLVFILDETSIGLESVEAFIGPDDSESVSGEVRMLKTDLISGNPVRRMLILREPFGIPHQFDDLMGFFGDPDDTAEKPDTISGFWEVIRLTMFYRDIELGFTISADGSKTVFDSFVLSGDTRSLLYGLSIGSTREEILDVLGEPDERQPLWHYGSSEESENSLTFLFRDNQVYEITWLAYIP